MFARFRLQLIDLQLENLRDFFHTDTIWMTQLNEHVIPQTQSNVWSKEYIRQNMLVVRLEAPERFNSFTRAYEFPDADFCLFRRFPHGRLAFPVPIFARFAYKCTCTVRFLAKDMHIPVKYMWASDYFTFYSHTYSYYYNYFSLAEYNSSTQYCQSKMYNSTGEPTCDFARMLSICETKTFHVSQHTTFLRLHTDTDFLYLVKFVQFVLLIVLKPLFCVVTMATNIMIILVITNKSKKKAFKDQMYKLLLLNAVFNIVYSVIMALKLVNECLFYNSPLFCSSVYQTIESQYFKVIYSYQVVVGVFKITKYIPLYIKIV